MAFDRAADTRCLRHMVTKKTAAKTAITPIPAPVIAPNDNPSPSGGLWSDGITAGTGVAPKDTASVGSGMAVGCGLKAGTCVGVAVAVAWLSMGAAVGSTMEAGWRVGFTGVAVGSAVAVGPGVGSGV